MFFLLLLLINIRSSLLRQDDDYLSNNYDENKNCKKEDAIKRLVKEGQCVTVSKGKCK